MKFFCNKCNTLVYKTTVGRPRKHDRPSRAILNKLGAGCTLVQQGDVPHIRCRCGLLIVILKAGNA